MKNISDVQLQSLYKNLNEQEHEVADYYKNMLGLLATDFVDLFVKTTDTNKKEVGVSLEEVIKLRE